MEQQQQTTDEPKVESPVISVPEETAVVEDSTFTRSYFDCGTSATINGLISPQKSEDEDEEQGLDEPMPFSDLSDPLRDIWIVTTAALPWRTGTAVNPFLRALYLVRRRLHLYTRSSTATATATATAAGTDGENGRKAGKVTLVIPWLVALKDAEKLYGNRITKSGEEGKEQQIQWIKDYAAEQCSMKGELCFLSPGRSVALPA